MLSLLRKLLRRVRAWRASRPVTLDELARDMAEDQVSRER